MSPAVKEKTLSNHHRSFKGCWTCKKRRIQCDEVHPTCRKCRSRGITCEGYEIRLRWGAGIASRGKYSGAEKPVKESIPPRSKRRWDLRGQGQGSPLVVHEMQPIIASQLSLAGIRLGFFPVPGSHTNLDLKQPQLRSERVTVNILNSPWEPGISTQNPTLNKHFEIPVSLNATAGTGSNAHVVDRQGLDTPGQGDWKSGGRGILV
ncbi:uncharacterized protein N7515_002834 [Penicillium bovifimosum]|uniref:Zn(2)-C6 fungal-type domain-containing protein n=1 Tax=Penicillium bovifimosum TaxID=126998 RepID=A0A9W9LA20_9EURO|nr:uncharacterized protein N7515_002834 [Penicillium bovifimosum]KAJ5144047.1 hypothetical protein N7515_002834 [Penicillium bovifimosum]